MLARTERKSNATDFRPRRNKYGAKKTVVDNVTFASQREAHRYLNLKSMFRAGLIRNLELQPEFPFKIDGVLMFKYVADFAYFEGQARIVEDAKGFKTAVYKLKKKLIEATYGIKIREV